MFEIRTVLHLQCGQPIFLFCGDARYLYKLDKNEIMNFEGARVPDEHVAICNQCAGLLQTKDLVLKSDPVPDYTYYDTRQYYIYAQQLQQQMKLQQQMQLSLDKAAYATFKAKMMQNAYSGYTSNWYTIDDKIKS